MKENKTERHSLAYNGLMNLVYTGSRILFPLLTAPYLARVLGAESTGRVDFVISIANYFVLIASLGIPTYGIRVCAEAGNDREQLNQSVQELLIINLVAAFISLLFYGTCILVTPRLRAEYPVAIIGGSLIIFRTFCVDWFYQGIEQYGYITARTLIIRCITIVFIFLTIHSPENYMEYGVSCVIMDAGAGIWNLYNLRKYVSLKRRGQYQFRRHLKPIFIFFLSSVAISIYNQIDVTMIGWMRGAEETGFYEYGIKAVKVVWTVLIGLTSVIMPRIISYIRQQRTAEESLLRRKAAQGIFLIALPMVVFLFFISRELILFLFGPSYQVSVSVFRIFIFAVIPVSFSNYLANIILLPHGREKQRALAVNAGLAADVILNIILIPNYGAVGAAFATLCAETTVCLGLFLSSLKFLKDALTDFKWHLKMFEIISCVILGWIAKKIPIANLFMKILISGLIFSVGYFFTLLAFQESLLLEILDKWKNDRRKRRA